MKKKTKQPAEISEDFRKAASAFVRIGGMAKSPAKTLASRENQKKAVAAKKASAEKKKLK